MNTIEIFYYKTSTGKEPFWQWLDELDVKSRAVIKSRIDRMSCGNFGDAKNIKNGQGVWELRIDYGPGFRVYFAREQQVVVIILCAGDKGTQSRDIDKAKKYWGDIRRNYEKENKSKR